MMELCCKLHIAEYVVLLNFEVLDVIAENIFKVTLMYSVCWEHSLEGTVNYLGIGGMRTKLIGNLVSL